MLSLWLRGWHCRAVSGPEHGVACWRVGPGAEPWAGPGRDLEPTAASSLARQSLLGAVRELSWLSQQWLPDRKSSQKAPNKHSSMETPIPPLPSPSLPQLRPWPLPLPNLPALALSRVKCLGPCLFTPMEDLTRPSPALIWSPELLSVQVWGGKTESGIIFLSLGMLRYLRRLQPPPESTPTQN